ncbi:MAG TPA: MarC family protein [Bryobacteraceae bacterium]|nr:MarC family protein [Bryobacteraceae bacterium]
MSAEAEAILEFSLMTVSSVFFIVDPFATIPAFVVMTEHDSAIKRARMARQAAWTCFLVLTAFAFTGSVIFKMFSITLPAFKIAGGLLLFMVAIDMLQARRSPTQESAEERAAASAKEEVGISPIGIPMLAGPGAISTVIVLMGQSTHWWQAVPVFSAIALTAAASYYILAGANKVRGLLGEIGIRVLGRLMGLVLVAIAVQFVLNGLADIGMAPRSG